MACSQSWLFSHIHSFSTSKLSRDFLDVPSLRQCDRTQEKLQWLSNGKSITNIILLKWYFFKLSIFCRYLKFIVIVILLAIFGIFMGIDSYDSPERLRSLLGVVILLAIGFAFSKHRTHVSLVEHRNQIPNQTFQLKTFKCAGILIKEGLILTNITIEQKNLQINWRTVICGVSLQFLMGLFCIRIDFGRKIFECLGDRVAVFFEFAREGAAFVYGEYLVNGNQTLNLASVFVFSVSNICYLTFRALKRLLFFLLFPIDCFVSYQSLPVIFFFSFIVSILYYYGAMQWIIKQMGCLLQSIMGTTSLFFKQ